MNARNRAQRQPGQWTGVRVLHRRDADGTEWRIIADPLRCRADMAYVLTMAYRGIRLTSHHATADAAKAHVDDLLASWQARSLSDYGATR